MGSTCQNLLGFTPTSGIWMTETFRTKAWRGLSGWGVCVEVMAYICGPSPAPGRESSVCHMTDQVMQWLWATTKFFFFLIESFHVHHCHHLWYKVKKRAAIDKQPWLSLFGRDPGYKSPPLTLVVCTELCRAGAGTRVQPSTKSGRSVCIK